MFRMTAAACGAGGLGVPAGRCDRPGGAGERAMAVAIPASAVPPGAGWQRRCWRCSRRAVRCLPAWRQVGDPVAVLPVAYHLLWQRELSCDLSVLLGRDLGDVAGTGGEHVMAGHPGAGGFRAGDRVIVDGRPRVVLGASGTAMRFAGDDGAVEEAPVAELAGSGRLRLQPRGTGGQQGAQVGLAGLPPEAVEQARWWEAHIIEVVDGTAADAPPGRRRGRLMTWSARACGERELAKAAELSAPGRPVAASYCQAPAAAVGGQGPARAGGQEGDAAAQPGRAGRSRSRRGDGAGDRRGNRGVVADGDVHRVAHPAAARRAGTGGPGAVSGPRCSGCSPGCRGQAHDRVGGNPPGPGGPAAADVLPGVSAAAPGELMEIDSTPLDVLVLLDDGVPGPGGADRDDRRGDPDSARGGAAALDPVGGRQRAAGPRAHARADAARLAGAAWRWRIRPCLMTGC